MKKYLKYIILTIVIIIILIAVLTKPKNITMITFSHLYSQYLKDEEVIRVPILVEGKTYYTDINSIVDVNMKDENNKIPLKINDIKKEEYSMYYNDTKYNVYMFDLIPDIKSEMYKINLSNAILGLTYKNEETVNVEFGDMNLMYRESTSDLRVKILKPIINEVNGYETVVAFIIGLENVLKEDVTITNFNINSNPAFVNNELIKEVEEHELDIKTNILEIIPKYNFHSTSSKTNEFIINSGETKYYVVPITYKKISFLYRFPIEITYNNNVFVYDDFIFMNYGYFPEFILNTKKIYELDYNK